MININYKVNNISRSLRTSSSMFKMTKSPRTKPWNLMRRIYKSKDQIRKFWSFNKTFNNWLNSYRTKNTFSCSCKTQIFKSNKKLKNWNFRIYKKWELRMKLWIRFRKYKLKLTLKRVNPNRLQSKIVWWNNNWATLKVCTRRRSNNTCKTSLKSKIKNSYKNNNSKMKF